MDEVVRRTPTPASLRRRFGGWAWAVAILSAGMLTAWNNIGLPHRVERLEERADSTDARQERADQRQESADAKIDRVLCYVQAIVGERQTGECIR